jgi:hypothetical protein
MAIITGSSQAVTYGIELDSYRAEAAAKALDNVIQGDALSAQARVESFGLIYANPPFDAEFGESGNQRFEVLFLSHFARWLVPGGVLIYVLPAQQLAGCANVLASHFRDIHVLRLASPECVLYDQIVVFADCTLPARAGPRSRLGNLIQRGTTWYPQHDSMRRCRSCRKGESNCGFRRPVPRR